MSDDFELKMDGLNKLMKALKAKMPIARIGILGGKGARKDGGSNALIGAAHEFGTSSLPQRSFLRVPIADNLNKELDKSGAFDPDTLKEVLKEGSWLPWTKKLAIVAEGIVLGAFESGGYGKWKPSNMAHKANQQTLVETGQLRDSITSEVKEG